MQVQGVCYLLVAFDAGFAIDMEKAEQRIGARRQRVALKDKRRAPTAVQLAQQPIRTSQTAQPLTIGDWRTGDSVDIVLYEFGSVSLTYHVRLAEPLSRLVELSWHRYDHEALLADAREQVQRIIAVIGDALEQPHPLSIDEDYAVFELTPVEGGITRLVAEHGPTLAQILRGEIKPLSQQEVDDALTRQLSYGSSDLCLVDWSAAVLVGEDMIDERAVLEFATVEAVELKSLDAQLDRALNEAYDLITPDRTWHDLLFGSMRKDMQRLAHLQVDNAFVFEAVTNAQKLLGDQYLAEVYHAAFERYHLAEWSATIDRKLNIIENIYDKLADQAATRRMEALEWIIIILIAISIAIYFVPVGV